MAEKGKQTQDQYYSRPPKLSGWESFKIFFWNSETNQFCGRTGSSWAKILLFYFIFYAVLVGFFAALLAVFYQTLDSHTPKWLLDRSLIGSNPGLGFRPMPPESDIDSTLIWYKSSDKGNTKHWQEEIAKFLSGYNISNNPHKNNIDNCEIGRPAPEGRVCNVHIDESWSPCVKRHGYNYNNATGGPCIFLKLNKIFGWVPDYYNKTNLPGHMPQYLKDYVLTEDNEVKLKTVWVSCDGENPADVENMGVIYYYPTRGFTGEYFPFKNQAGYLSPVVAVHFKAPKRGVLINIECKAWAKNIHHDRADRRGSVHFELMID